MSEERKLSLVSVIIPCYNSAKYLGEAIQSALNQTYDNLEVLVVDDGSADDTSLVVERYKADKRLKYIRQENGGLSSARNLGIQNSSGNYLALLDADDVWEKELVATQVGVLDSENACGMVFTDFLTFDENGVVALQRNSVIQNDLHSVNFTTLLQKNNFIYPSTVMIRKDIISESGKFDVMLRSAEDYDLWLRISRVAKILGINQPLVRIRQHSSNMSRNIRQMADNERLVIDKYRHIIPFYVYRRRMAKIYMINADRSVHLGERFGAFTFLLKGVVLWPFVGVDLLVVMIKLILGGNTIIKLRRKINNKNSMLSWLYWQIYRRY